MFDNSRSLPYILTMHKVHGFACGEIIITSRSPPELARFQCVHETALKPTHEAGRRGGDSIARRHVFNYHNSRRQRVVVTFCCAGLIRGHV